MKTSEQNSQQMNNQEYFCGRFWGTLYYKFLERLGVNKSISNNPAVIDEIAFFAQNVMHHKYSESVESGYISDSEQWRQIEYAQSNYRDLTPKQVDMLLEAMKKSNHPLSETEIQQYLQSTRWKRDFALGKSALSVDKFGNITIQHFALTDSLSRKGGYLNTWNISSDDNGNYIKRFDGKLYSKKNGVYTIIDMNPTEYIYDAQGNKISEITNGVQQFIENQQYSNQSDSDSYGGMSLK